MHFIIFTNQIPLVVFFLPFRRLALSSISLIKFFIKQIVLLKFASLLRLKSMLRMLAKLVSFFSSISVGLIIRLMSSWDENDAEEDSRDLLCSD